MNLGLFWPQLLAALRLPTGDSAPSSARWGRGRPGGETCVKALAQRPASSQMVVAVTAGGCWVQGLPQGTRASGRTRDHFLVLEPWEDRVRVCLV